MKFKGRLILLENIADGADPATHTILGLYHSMAEDEAYAKAIANDPDWLKSLAAFEVATPYVGTSMPVQGKARGPATAKSCTMK